MAPWLGAAFFSDLSSCLCRRGLASSMHTRGSPRKLRAPSYIHFIPLRVMKSVDSIVVLLLLIKEPPKGSRKEVCPLASKLPSPHLPGKGDVCTDRPPAGAVRESAVGSETANMLGTLFLAFCPAGREIKEGVIESACRCQVCDVDETMEIVLLSLSLGREPLYQTTQPIDAQTPRCSKTSTAYDRRVQPPDVDDHHPVTPFAP
ncbi:hypothetical protein C8Q76DRAFT_697400 [Earliella scabrosa]|nr:hypothetical protein C8Q76DRAFT_697400 [Earliella scabrosa]